MKIVIVDYGMGNLASVYNAFSYLGVKPKIVESPEDLGKAEKIVLPGVGAFENSMNGLKKRKLVEPLKEAISAGKKYLGMCLGLQLLFEKSEEGNSEGLGILKGGVRRFKKEDGVKVPHIGWNNVAFQGEAEKTGIMKGIKNNSRFYFVHSYYADPEDKSIIVGITDYGVKFASMICKDNISAVQFHPERSQELGLAVLKNFIEQ